MLDNESSDYELDALLALDRTSYEWRQGYVLEFSAWRVSPPPQRPHGLRCALVLRRKTDGKVLVRYDSAHGLCRQGRGYSRKASAHDHRHKGSKVRPYAYTSPSQLLEDFFADVQEVIGREQKHR